LTVRRRSDATRVGTDRAVPSFTEAGSISGAISVRGATTTAEHEPVAAARRVTGCGAAADLRGVIVATTRLPDAAPPLTFEVSWLPPHAAAMPKPNRTGAIIRDLQVWESFPHSTRYDTRERQPF
jgi:hypothetical protein